MTSRQFGGWKQVTTFSSTFVAILSLRFFLCRGEGASCMAYKYRKFRVVIQVLLYIITINNNNNKSGLECNPRQIFDL